MSERSFVRTTGYKGNDLFAMGRAKGTSGSLIVQSDVSSISYRVMDTEDDEATPTTGSLTVASVIFNTPQTTTLDPRWPSSAPTGGYNFGAAIPGSTFSAGGKKYAVQVDALLTSGKTVTLYGGIHSTRVYY